jgi:probable rRNA maturation factor
MTPSKVTFSLRRTTRSVRFKMDARDWESLARFVMDRERVQKPLDLNLELTSHARIQALNRRFRGVDRTTDVIAFRDELGPLLPTRVSGEGWDEGTLPLPSPFTLSHLRRERGILGDIAINVQQAALQAKAVGHSLRREIRLLLIHGLLHLVGYTDERAAPRRRMFRRQNDLLRHWERCHS